MGPFVVRVASDGRTGTWMMLLSLAALITGFFPVAAIVAFTWGVVLKLRGD